ncbi:MAG TPA: PrsW family glutamic-type intramembrane protease [Candidatus Peribacteraceae bacterium]|nr:PrsW family glutamic-type intramembrane protease [Candidatus Peribacteraceae bacterium]
MAFSISTTDFLSPTSLVVLCAVAALASIDLARRWKHQPTHLLFATIFGSALSVGLIQIGMIFLKPGLQDNAFAMAFAVVLTVLGWKMLFGPWETQTKAVMLGSFLFWITLHLALNDDPKTRLPSLIAAATALVPAIIWCLLFLKYHTERKSAVVLMFLSGMLATVPVLFYDALVRHGVALQFFLFQIKPESFSQIAQTFIASTSGNDGSVKAVLLSSLLSFIIVGIIEETSKFWALTHSARKLFSSIDDVLQLAIMVAIGFSFAENIINPVYFTAFVQDYLTNGNPDLLAFLSNVLGRSVLTTMVHIVATGTLGYFLGLAIFAGPYLQEQHARGRTFWILSLIQGTFRIREISIFRVQMIMTGLTCAILLHGIFNFLVTVPDILPGHPQTLRDLLGSSSPVLLDKIPLLLLPSLFYVVGGFWWLTHLFLKKEDMHEYGHLMTNEVFVEAQNVQ